MLAGRVTSSNRNQFPLSSEKTSGCPVLGSKFHGWLVITRNCCHKLKPTKTRHATSLLSDSPRLVVGGGLNLKLSELSCSHEWLWSGRRLEERCSKTGGSLCLLRHSVLSLAEVLPRTVLTETLRHWRYKHLDTITIRPPPAWPDLQDNTGSVYIIDLTGNGSLPGLPPPVFTCLLAARALTVTLSSEWIV